MKYIYIEREREGERERYSHTSEMGVGYQYLRHCDKVHIAMELHKLFGFRVHIKVMVTLYRSLLCAIALRLKNVHTLIKKYFIA